MNGFETILSAPWIRAVAWALVHFLWQGALVAFLVATALAMIPRQRGQARALVAVTGLALLFLLPIVTTGVIISLQPHSVSFSAGPGAIPGSTVQTEEPAFVLDRAERAGFPPAPGTPGGRVEPWLPVVLLVWILGVGGLSLRNLGSLLAVRRLTTRGTFPVPEAWPVVLRRLATRLGVRPTVRLLGSHRISVPTTVGWLRPVILLPASALAGLTPGQLEAILAHELAHIRRHDYLVNLLQTVVETLLFYHPAVWWVSRQIRIEREHCCDDLAVATCGDVRVYLEALTRLEVLRSTGPSLAMAANGGSLLSRVRRLAGIPPSKPRGMDRWLSGSLVLVAALAFGGIIVFADGGRHPSTASTTSSSISHSQSEPLLAQDSRGRGRTSSTENEGSSPDKSAKGSRSGTWKAHLRGNSIEVELRGHGVKWYSSFGESNLRGAPIDIEALFEKTEIDVEFPREAGTFHITGTTQTRGDERKGEGEFTFRPDPQYTETLRKLGFAERDVEKQQFDLAYHDVTTAYARDLVEAGYDDLTVSRLLEFKIHGITAEYARGMASAGYADLSADKLLEFKIHGVQPEYVQAMNASGYAGLTPNKLLEFKIHGVQPDYVQAMNASGYADLTANKLLEFKIHGVQPEYVQAMNASGYADLTANKLLEFKIHGVQPEWVQELSELGYPDVPADKLLEFKIHGVSPQMIRELQERGLTDLTPDELIEIKIHGMDRVLSKRKD